MKRILSLALAIVALVALQAQGEGKRYQVAGVAFYNLENLFDTIPNNPLGRDAEYTPTGTKQWTGKRYWNKIHNLAYVINNMKTDMTPLGPAIIGVAEVENISVLADLVRDEQIKNLNLQIIHHDSPDRRGIDVGFLFNPRLFRPLSVTHHTLHVAENPDLRTRDQTCVSGLLMGEHVSVIVGHWPSRLGGQSASSYLREAAASLAKSIADSVLALNPKEKIIILGDLNDDPMDKSCAEVIGAKRKVDDVKEGGWYNPFWDVLANGIGTLAYKGQWNLFDQIMVNYNLVGKDRSSFKYFKCKVLNDIPGMRTEEGDRQGYPLRTYSAGMYLNGFSDHFPTQIFLTREIK